MGSWFGLGKIQGPSIKTVVITSIIAWIIKTIYIHFIGVIIFPSKNTNCNFRKSLILIAFVQTPLILNIIIFDKSLLFLILITYIWYNICLIIGINIIYNYKNIFKATLIAVAPLIIFLIYIISNFAGNPVTLT